MSGNIRTPTFILDDTVTPSYNDIEIDLLRQALSAFPSGVNSSRNQESAEYRAAVRLERAGLLEADSKYSTFDSSGPIYMGLNITEFGRENLANAESNGNGDAERTTYVNVILVVLDNPTVQLGPEDMERIRTAVQQAPLARLREVVGWLGTVVTLADFGVKLVATFIGT